MKKKKKKINSLTWGLFNCRFPYHWGKDFIIMLKRIPFVIKNGYQEQATWETFSYMIEIWEEILLHYKEGRSGTPVLINAPTKGAIPDEEWEKENNKAFNDYIDAMIAELRVMAVDPLDDPNGISAGNQVRQEATDKFFTIFKDIFYHLWD